MPASGSITKPSSDRVPVPGIAADRYPKLPRRKRKPSELLARRVVQIRCVMPLLYLMRYADIR
jgi:hypothetical protein